MKVNSVPPEIVTVPPGARLLASVNVFDLAVPCQVIFKVIVRPEGIMHPLASLLLLVMFAE